MNQEELKELNLKFKEAYARCFGKEDIDWKDMGYGKKLAYLNWASAWRAMKEVYPDANYRLIETPDGSPLWDINGYGMLKCAVSAMGIEHIETFPIMDNRNNAMKVAPNGNYPGIDARDINDSMQRGLTKACARFGIGLYIYEGKLESPKDLADKPVNYEPLKEPNYSEPELRPATTDEGPIIQPKSTVELITESQNRYIDELLAKKGVDDKYVKAKTGISIANRGVVSKADATKVIRFLIGEPNKPKQAPTQVASADDLPF